MRKGTAMDIYVHQEPSLVTWGVDSASCKEIYRQKFANVPKVTGQFFFNADCNDYNLINQDYLCTTSVFLWCRHKDTLPVLHTTCMQTLKPHTNDANCHIVYAATITEVHILCCLPAVRALTDISQAAANYTSPKARQNVFSNMKTFVFQGPPPPNLPFLRRCLISIRNLSWYKFILHSRVLAATRQMSPVRHKAEKADRQKRRRLSSPLMIVFCMSAV